MCCYGLWLNHDDEQRTQEVEKKVNALMQYIYQLSGRGTPLEPGEVLPVTNETVERILPFTRVYYGGVPDGAACAGTVRFKL